MMNGPRFSPIFFAVVLALAASSGFVARAQTAPPLPATNAPAPTAAPAVAPAPTDVTGAPAEQPTTYTVVAGDSLWKIAHHFDISIKKLKKLNKLKNNNLKPGQVLQIPPATSTTGSTPKTTSHHKAKTILPTQPEVASTATAETQTESPIQPPPDTAAFAVQASSATPTTAVVQTKPVHHHKKKPVSTQEPEVAGTHRAQPVQDFDVPASTFASCPVPIPVETDQDQSTPPPTAQPAAPAVSQPVAEDETPAPRAVLVSPSELAAASAPPPPTETVTETPVPEPGAAPAPEATPAPDGMASSESSKHSGDSFVTDSTPDNGENSLNSPSVSSGDWADRFKREAEDIADRDIDYDESWRPPGESHAWEMDCSNTSRYIYKVTTGLELPRTASDQYYYLHLQNKAWDVPQTADGFADTSYLRENLKPGDLLFWENTYRPERQPPITHVMIFLGTNEKGQWIMVGSQTSRGGLHNRRHGGPDIYVFDPTKPCGGYSTWLGLVHHQGRFCAFGRPLEADPSKLAVAND